MFYPVFTLFERLTNLFELNKFWKIIKKKWSISSHEDFKIVQQGKLKTNIRTLVILRHSDCLSLALSFEFVEMCYMQIFFCLVFDCNIINIISMDKETLEVDPSYS